MEYGTIAGVIEDYANLFGLDLSDLQSDIAQAVLERLEKEPPTGGRESDVLLHLRKTVLFEFTQIARIRGRVDRVLTDFQRQIEDQIYDFTFYRRQEPLPQEMVELMYEAQGLWNNMPHQLVAKHYNLVKKAAAHYHKTRKIDDQLAFSDLVSAAGEALFSAASRMYRNPKKDFRSFAWKILKEKIREEQAGDNPVPHKVRQKLSILRNKREEFGIDGNSLADVTRLAERTGFSPAEIKSLCEIEAVWGGGTTVDTDGILDDIEIADLSPDALTLMISQETCELMDEAIAGLPTVQQQLIDNIYFRDMSLREAADHMNISLNVLRKIHQKAIARLKELVDDADEVSVLL